MQLKNTLRLCSILAGLALASVSAQAAPSYGDLAAPGVYFGTGNPNGDWTIDTANGIELGLRAKEYKGATLDGSSGTYFAAAGLYSGPGNARATWNYEFSVNIGTHSFTEGLRFELGVDHDPSAGQNFTFVDPRTWWADNAMVANGFQNSQNVIFQPFLGLCCGTPGGAFDVNQNGVYSFVLNAYDANNGLLASTSMNVQVGQVAAVPEPETYALMLAGLGLVGFIARRRSRK